MGRRLKSENIKKSFAASNLKLTEVEKNKLDVNK